MNYSQALDIIIKKQSLGIQPGLERIYALLKKMGDPQKNLKIIHVAGTNGKGTVCCTLAKSLADHGLKVGLFTSPWVTDYREQIQINSSFISEKDLAGYIENYSAYDATEFELITAIAYKYFYDHNVDIAVVECGMGGAGDSTNAIPTPELAVITAVSMDHTDFLGNTLEDIAREKSGIIKEKGKVILYPNPKVNSIFKEKCKAVNAEWIEVEDTGEGMTEKEFDSMRRKMKNASIELLENEKGVGIINACLRLKMMSHDRVQFELNGEEGTGVSVLIRLPFIESEKG